MELSQAVDAVRAFHKQMVALQVVVDCIREIGDLENVRNDLRKQRQVAEKELSDKKIEIEKAKSSLNEVSQSLVKIKKEAERVKRDGEKQAADLISRADAEAQRFISEAKAFKDARIEENEKLVKSLQKKAEMKATEVASFEEKAEELKKVIQGLKERFNV